MIPGGNVMICIKCGNELSADAKFCDFCGAEQVEIPHNDDGFVLETAGIIPESPEYNESPEFPDIPAIPESPVFNDNAEPFAVEIPQEPPLVAVEQPAVSLADKVKGFARRVPELVKNIPEYIKRAPELAKSLWERILEIAKKLGWVKFCSICAGAVAVIVGLVFVLNFAFNRAGFVHALSGDKKYALSMIQQDSFGTMAITALSGNLPLAGIVPEEGVTVELNAETNLSVSDSEEMNTNVAALNSIKAVLGLKPDGADLNGTAQITENDAELARADMLLSDGRLYFLAPDTEPLYMETGYNTASTELSAISEISDNAEFAFGKPDVGGFNGKMMTVILRGQVVRELMKVDFAESSVLTIKYYINNNNTLAGSRYTLVSDRGEAELFWLDNPKSGFSMFAKNENGELKLLQEKTSDTGGRLVITRNSGSSRTFTVEYTDFERKNLFGKDLILGKFTCSDINGEFKIGNAVLDSVTLEFRDNNGALDVTAELSSNGAKFTVNAKITSGCESAKIDTSHALDVKTLETADRNKIFTSVTEHYLPTWSASQFMNSVKYDGQQLRGIIELQYNIINRERVVKENYAGYDSDTLSESENYARRIYLGTAVYSDQITLYNPSPTIVKLYYDKDGKFYVIENTALSDVLIDNFSKNEMKSAYVEITLRKGEKNNGLCGVTVIRTDDKSKIPSNLPSVYNYLDTEFAWGGENNVGYIGAFAAGTFPKLNNVASGKGGDAETAYNKLFSSVSDYDKIAEKTLVAFKDFISDNNLSVGSGGNRTVLFKADANGNWNLSSTARWLLGNEYALEKYMSEQVSNAKNKYIYVYIDKNGNAAAASVSDKDTSLSVPMFTVGETTWWSVCEGNFDGDIIGTYPKLRGFSGTFSDSVKSALKGKWKQGNNLVTISDDNLSHVKTVVPNSGYVEVTLDDGRKYLFDLDGIMIDEYMKIYRKN